MTLEGANIFFDATDYTIYTMNSVTTGRYCVVLPKNNNGTYNMLVDLHMKNSFDSINNGSKTKEQLIEEIKNEYSGVKTKYSDGILVIPMIDENLYASAILNNDKQKMFDKVKKIGAITSEIYKKLTDSGIDKQKIDQKIIIIIKNNDDIKFVDWLKEQMPNFVIGVNSSELQNTNNVNPFMENNNPFMPETPVTTTPTNDNVFGSAPANNVANNDIFSTTASNNPTPTNDIFSTTAPATNNVIENAPFQANAEVQQPVVEQSATGGPITEIPNIFGAPTTQEPISVVNNQNLEQPTQEPTPVQSTPLEATTTITPIAQPESTPTTNPVEQNTTTGSPEGIPEKKGSKGFTNLIILIVVLVGVTFISIELGKFLYNTYGV